MVSVVLYIILDNLMMTHNPSIAELCVSIFHSFELQLLTIDFYSPGSILLESAEWTLVYFKRFLKMGEI